MEGLFRQPANRAPRQEVLARKEFEGHYRHVTFENEDGSYKVVTFCAGEDEFKAAGNLFGAGAGEPLRIRGEWREHPKHGWTFHIENFLVQTPSTEEGIQAYLGSGLIKGVGKRTAQRIVEKFGEGTLEVLDKTPEVLTEVKGISRRLAREISRQWNEHRTSREAMIFLKENGLTTALALRLVKHYGDNVVAVMRTNPYRAGLEVPMIGFATADQIARKLGISEHAPERLEAALVHVLDDASGEGHTHLPKEDLLIRAAQLLNVPIDDMEPPLASVVSKGYVKETTLEEETPVYFIPSLYACESGCAELIGELIRQERPLLHKDVDEGITEFESKFHFELAPQQRDAIRSAVSGGVCVITGGPGTGKTTLVRALLYIVKKKSLRIALCSPTGRAAQRLSETTREDAATIHRLLKWNAQTGRFQHNAENRLPVDLLIVDEASMLDIPLAYSLLRAIPNGATVVFVGDVDQLPSVGPGSFLRDLIQSGRGKTTRLNVIFRQAEQSLIIRNSHRINEGKSIQVAGKDQEGDFFFIERNDPEQLRDALLTMALERIPKKTGVDPVEEVQVLSPMRRGALGTGELNKALQERLNPNGRVLIPNLPFRLGDKVIQTSNNYDLDVYNGDVGRLVSMDTESQLVRVRFGKRSVHYPLDCLNELELAYAITIHKSQGSEYPAVLVLMHTSHFIMLKRNLLYTAVTRGKRLVVVLGNRSAVMKAIKTSSEKDRRTALEYWLTRPERDGKFL